MKIEVKQHLLHEGTYVSLQEIFCNTVLETAEGNQLSVCMRDDTIELHVIGTLFWWRVNMQTGHMELLASREGEDNAEGE